MPALAQLTDLLTEWFIELHFAAKKVQKLTTDFFFNPLNPVQI